jgi:hypothetical protein
MTSVTERTVGARAALLLGGNRAGMIGHMTGRRHTPTPRPFMPGDEQWDNDGTFIPYESNESTAAVIIGTAIPESIISPQEFESDHLPSIGSVREFIRANLEWIDPASPGAKVRGEPDYARPSVGHWVPSPISIHLAVPTPDSHVYDQGHARFRETDPARLVNIVLGRGVHHTSIRLGTQILEPQEQPPFEDIESYLTPVYRFTHTTEPMMLAPALSQQEPIAAEALHMELHLKSLLTELEADFAAEPFEDGMDHEAEQTLVRAFANIEAQYLLTLLTDFCTDVTKPNFSASILRCLGRLNDPGTQAWRTQLISDALAKGNPEIRDAAVQAVEQWDEPRLASVLKSHQEQLPWLQDYIRDVLQGMEG